MTPPAQPDEYQCSWCKRNKFKGDKTCPLNLEGSNGNSDIFNGVNRVIKSCGCGSFIDTRSRPAPAAPKKELKDMKTLHDRECFMYGYRTAQQHHLTAVLDNGETFMIAIEKRIEFCQNLGYDGKNPLLGALINLREQILLLADCIDEEEQLRQSQQHPNGKQEEP